MRRIGAVQRAKLQLLFRAAGKQPCSGTRYPRALNNTAESCMWCQTDVSCDALSPWNEQKLQLYIYLQASSRVVRGVCPVH